MLEGADDSALDGQGVAGDTGAGGGGVAAAPKPGGNVIDVDLLALGAEADAREAGGQFFEDAGHHDRGDGADVVDEALGIGTLGAGPAMSSGTP